jgi:hypothetical protein
MEVLKNKLTLLPHIPLLGIQAKEFESIYKRDTCIFMLTKALFTIVKLRIQLRCLTTDE